MCYVYSILSSQHSMHQSELIVTIFTTNYCDSDHREAALSQVSGLRLYLRRFLRLNLGPFVAISSKGTHDICSAGIVHSHSTGTISNIQVQE